MQNDMRDRLIELFNAIEENPAITCPHYKTDKTCDECKYTINNVMCNHTLRTVDYLIANGAILPPVKVGDNTFLLLEKTMGDYDIVKSKCVKIVDNGLDKVFSMYIDCKEIGNTLEFRLSDIGKTVFLTEQEAREAVRKEDEGK